MTLLSCEIEYIIGSYATCQAVWIATVLKESKVNVEKPIMLQIDDKSTINLAKKSSSTWKEQTYRG
jgi:hypothetical protein